MSRGHLVGMPEDERWWAILYYDGFSHGHAGTTSTGVSVLLQDLQPYYEPAKTGKTPPMPDDLALWRKNADPPDKTRVYTQRLVRIFVGSLCLLSIGRIIHKRKVTESSLPVEHRTLSMNREDTLVNRGDVQAHPFDVGILGHDLPGPPSWTLKTAENLIDNRIMRDMTHIFPEARYLHLQQGDDSYIIPRGEIHRRFFAYTSELANAIEGKHWNEAKKELVCFEKLPSGLESGEFKDPHRYQVILQRGVPESLARLLAILCFDRLGLTCATEIFNRKKLERTWSNNRWFTSARIPMRGTPEEPFSFDVECWDLGKRGEDERAVFLVTRITTCAPPSYLPPMSRESVGSNRLSPHVRDETPRPRSGSGRSPLVQETSEDVALSNTADANVGAGFIVIPTDDPLWRDGTSLPLIPKTSHRSSEPGRAQPPRPPPMIASSGRRGFANGNPPAASIGGQSAHHARFASLISAFLHLLNKSVIEGFTMFAPEESGYLARRQGARVGNELPCWDLRAIEEKILRRKPCAWSYAQKPLAGHEHVYVPRSACVVLIEGPLGRGYWIELETKSKEHFRSVFLARPTDNPQKLVESALVGLICCKGVFPAEGVSTQMYASMACQPMDFQHSYDPPLSQHISLASVRNSLIKARICPVIDGSSPSTLRA